MATAPGIFVFRPLVHSDPGDPSVQEIQESALPPDLATRLLVSGGYVVPGGGVEGLVSLSPAPVTTSAGSGSSSTSVAQGKTLLNNSFFSLANTPLVITIPGASGERVKLRSLNARTSAGVATFQIADGSSVIFAPGIFGLAAALASLQWATPLTGSQGFSMVITLGAAGAGNTTMLTIQADRDEG